MGSWDLRAVESRDAGGTSASGFVRVQDVQVQSRARSGLAH